MKQLKMKHPTSLEAESEQGLLFSSVSPHSSLRYQLENKNLNSQVRVYLILAAKAL